jgi:phosphate-selective porin OprO/OprP
MSCYPRACALLRFLAFVGLSATTQVGFSQQFSAPSDYDELLRRLDAAERRIAFLESPEETCRLPPVDNEEQIRLTPTSNTVSSVHSQEARLTRLESLFENRAAAEEEDKYEPPTKPTVKVGGRIHLDYWGFPDDTPGIGWFENPTTGEDPEDRWLFRRIRLELSGEILENMLWRMQVDFNTPDSPQIKDVYLGFDELPHNQRLLIGHQKRPLGLDHWNSSRFNVFMERPLVVEAYNQDARRLGWCMQGVSEDLSWTWQYGMYLLEDIQDDGRYIGDSQQASFNARLTNCPWYDETSGGRGYLHLALAGMLARPDGDVAAAETNNNEARFRTRPEGRSNNRWIDTRPIAGAEWYEIAAAEAILNIGALQFCSEIQSAWVQRDNTTPGTGPDVNFYGAYIYVSYFLTGEHMPYNREGSQLDRVHPFENFFLVPTCDGCYGTGWGALQVAFRYDFLFLSDEDIQGGNEVNQTLALNWWWNPYARLSLDVTHGEIDEHFPVGGFTDGRFWIVGARFSVDF